MLFAHPTTQIETYAAPATISHKLIYTKFSFASLLLKSFHRILQPLHIHQPAPFSKSPKLIQKWPSIPWLSFFLVSSTKWSTQIKSTHNSLRQVPQNLLNLLQNLRRQLWDHLKRLEVLRDLLRTRRTENDGRGVGVLRDPCECEGAHGCIKFYSTRLGLQLSGSWLWETPIWLSSKFKFDLNCIWTNLHKWSAGYGWAVGQVLCIDRNTVLFHSIRQ